MRHRLRAIQTDYGRWNRMRVVPQATLLAAVEILYAVVLGRFRRTPPHEDLHEAEYRGGLEGTVGKPDRDRAVETRQHRSVDRPVGVDAAVAQASVIGEVARQPLGEFAAELAHRGINHITPAAIHNHAAKLVRIRRLGPYLSRRRLRFLARSPDTQLLVDQLRDFPIAAHDDGPDALEMALRLAEAEEAAAV